MHGRLRHLILAAVAVAAWLILAGIFMAYPRDLDGRWANSSLKGWFDGLSSGKGPCCSFADGVSIRDVDWDTDGTHYRVRIDGRWIIVPDDAVIRVPNKFGPAVVWPYQQDGETKIRCFLRGLET